MEATLHAKFECQAARTPVAIAIVCEGQTLTYAELNERANQVAHFLIQSGVAPETPVALCLDRSVEMVLAILGVLKAGGFYIPIDFNYPAERIRYMLQDAGANILLTTEDLLSRMPGVSARTICMDRHRASILLESAANPEAPVLSQNAAYAIYTSGSTGKPKGVVVTHDNVLRLFNATSSWFEFTSTDVWSWFHSYTFDFSVWEFWGALLHGGRLVVVPYWVSRLPEAFLAFLWENRITVLNQTPSAFRMLSQADQACPTDIQSHVRVVIFGGEALETKSILGWFARHGDQRPRLINMYGITETTVHATYEALTSSTAPGTDSVIGQPIPDLQIYVLDENLRPSPGTVGELYISGPGLARGYLKRPDLTAERFLPDPFSKVPGNRLYRSGDLARCREDGKLEYCGRIDHQVKVRGHRIELGEIEADLMTDPSVHHAIVLAQDDGQGGKCLVAYVVTRSPADTLALRRRLATHVPDYMVPSTFVVLDSIPLTSHGKVDAQALRQLHTQKLSPSDDAGAGFAGVSES